MTFTVTLFFSKTKKYTTQVEADYPQHAVQEAIYKKPHKGLPPIGAKVADLYYILFMGGMNHVNSDVFEQRIDFYDRHFQNQRRYSESPA